MDNSSDCNWESGQDDQFVIILYVEEYLRFFFFVKKKKILFLCGKHNFPVVIVVDLQIVFVSLRLNITISTIFYHVQNEPVGQ